MIVMVVVMVMIVARHLGGRTVTCRFMIVHGCDCDDDHVEQPGTSAAELSRAGGDCDHL